MTPLPAWPDAVARFEDFLSAQGHPTELCWLFREDFFTPAFGKHFARFPPPAENAELAQRYFESARSKGLGLQLIAQFSLEGSTAATLWSPGEELGVDAAELSGLKFSASSPFVAALPVKSSLAWWSHQWRPAYRQQQRASFDIPLRESLAGRAGGGV